MFNDVVFCLLLVTWYSVRLRVVMYYQVLFRSRYLLEFYYCG